MKVYCAISIGQEINGSNVVLRIDKASVDKTKIDAYLNTNKPTWSEKFALPEGNVDMYFQRNAQEFEVEDVQ